MINIGFDSGLVLKTYYFFIFMDKIVVDPEFVFGILEVNNLNGYRTTMYDSAITNAIITKSCRTHLSGILQFYTQRLVDKLKVNSFFMETFCKNLPPAALVKYDVLCQIFSALGYTVTVTPAGEQGKRKWVMNLHP